MLNSRSSDLHLNVADYIEAVGSFSAMALHWFLFVALCVGNLYDLVVR